MAINIPIVTEFVDTGLKSASGAFTNFRNQVSQAEGGLGKLKAGAGAAFDGIKANAASMALGAGAAIGGFALKAIGDFKDLALSVDEFRNSTNLSLEESSKWMSFTGDLGIAGDSMVKVFDKLGKAIETNTRPFQDLGVEIVKTADGTTDLEATFLKTVDALNTIEDPARRARIQAELFGRGWMDAAEIINMSSDEIRASLDGINEFEIIDEEEIQKAKDLRAAQDRLGDAFAQLSVTLGEALIPALTQATDAAVPLLNAMKPLIEALGAGADANASYAEQASNNNVQMRLGSVLAEKLFGWFGWGKDQTEDLTEANYELLASWIKNKYEIIDNTDAVEDLTVSLEDVDYALAELKGNVDERQAWRNLIGEIEKVKESAIDAFVEGTPTAIRESEASLDKLRVELAEYIVETEGIPTEKKTDFLARLETANLDQIEAIFNQLGRPRTVEFRPTVSGIPLGPGETPSEVLGRGNRMATMSNVTVNVQGSVIAENDLVETVRVGLVKAQRNGAGLVYSNS